jgi:general L-amino acid transport system permease protein
VTDESTNICIYFATLLNTISMSVFVVIATSFLGALLAFLSYHHNPLVYNSVKIYIELFRNIPLLLQIIFWFNVFVSVLPRVRNSYEVMGIILNNRGLFLPSYSIKYWFWWLLPCSILVMTIFLWWRKNFSWIRLIIKSSTLSFLAWLVINMMFESLEYPKLGRFRIQGGFHIHPEFIGLALGLIFYTSSYVAESIRGCLQAVPKGQFEAARALGFTEVFLYRRVILPQALTAILPQLGSHYLNVAKNTSLGIAIGYPEVFGIFAGTILNQSGQAIEIMFMVMLTYLMISILITWATQRLNHSFESWTGVEQK